MFIDNWKECAMVIKNQLNKTSNKLMILLVCISLVAFLSIVITTYFAVNSKNKIAHDMSGVTVAYTADPHVMNDDQIVLGYPGQRFSVTCSSKSKQCVLELENKNSNTVKTFPYVEQEWFNPEHSNRPWHTLDTIMTLPSYNGNPDLKITKNPKQNRHLFDVMVKNGWVQ